MTQQQFYNSPAWRKCRAAYVAQRVAIDGGICEVCGQDVGRVVHHLIYLNDTNCNDADISLNPANLRYECQTCHNREENSGGYRMKINSKPKQRKIKYDEFGNIINFGTY